MELRHFWYFKIIAEELHFRKAAQRLNLSQPPLTRQIKELETELGVILFDRNNKRVKLTDAGAFLKSEVDRMFQNLEETKTIVRQIHESESGLLRVGYISSSHHVHLSDALRKMQQTYPFVKTKLFELPTSEQVKALEEGKLDIGILRAPIKSEKLKVVTLNLESFMVAMPVNNLVFKDLREVGAYLSKQPFIFFSKEQAPEYYEVVLELCQRMGFIPEIAHESNNVHSILRLIETGLGVSVIPKPMQNQYNFPNLTFYDLSSIPVTTELVIAYKNIEGNLAAKFFIDIYTDTVLKGNK